MDRAGAVAQGAGVATGAMGADLCKDTQGDVGGSIGAQV
jgi:hypothetical protein